MLNPATEEIIESFEAAGADEVDAAVERARCALPAWRSIDAGTRAQLLNRLAYAVEAATDELAGLESLNVGKPLRDAVDEVAMSVDILRYYAGAIDKHVGHTIPVDGGLDLTLHEPLGVVGLIVPWNFPFNTAVTKVAPALACGNTVVLKPSELTPLSALRLRELALDAGIPDGVVNVVVGTGPDAGERLVTHPDVAKIGFTGSTAVGRRVMSLASGTIKKVSLELGGKSANIVFADADVDRAAAQAPGAVFGNAGQDCCARSRILVEQSVYDRFLEGFVAASAALRVGPPTDTTADLGPLISAAQRDRVESFLTGDEPVAFRGEVPRGPGFWSAPTVLAPVDATARAAREEIFGPVACVIPFAHEAEAVALANDSDYGLSGSLWTTNVDRALRVARAIETGVLSINSNNSVFVATPFGGVKQSGLGRENGMEALAEYSQVKNVYISTRGPA